MILGLTLAVATGLLVAYVLDGTAGCGYGVRHLHLYKLDLDQGPVTQVQVSEVTPSTRVHSTVEMAKLTAHASVWAYAMELEGAKVELVPQGGTVYVGGSCKMRATIGRCRLPNGRFGKGYQVTIK
jgi:hypothetical protein